MHGATDDPDRIRNLLDQRWSYEPKSRPTASDVRDSVDVSLTSFHDSSMATSPHYCALKSEYGVSMTKHYRFRKLEWVCGWFLWPCETRAARAATNCGLELF
ncbi:hypothetical protein AG1IA_06237 [Rhizoctonia solani AG-1 IA]|uniref:Uncharacterized protein n=1 Tax=Thanatephorus cucumeris (strain AG1-IA) TaxID=983506 RepID=L8WSG4_THACA|nr:hypothetical protein AG1IA_06237 [Rhizoctonia solani AG-1 IA]